MPRCKTASFDRADVLRVGALIPVFTFTVGTTARDEHLSNSEPSVPPPCVIEMPDGSDGADGVYVANLWPGGIVPYAFHANVNIINQGRTRDAMDEIESVANITFVPRTTEADYVLFRHSDGNSSSVGRQGGAQNINMVSWGFHYILIHEMMHALGTWHEHQRVDRNDFIQVNLSNIPAQAHFAFAIRSGTLTGPYDFDSVMHYSQWTFSNCFPDPGCESITVLPPNEQWQGEIGQLDHMSEGDIRGLVSMYGLRCNMDFDNSGDVGFADLLVVLAAWGPCVFTCPEDVSGNGVVNAGDVTLLMAEWGACE